ncbi:hypothetical protein [Paraliomyxa miuraensis]|uniref:hypothetical protein n=1 Tax=Paraliomyxa miuraensis TaxID=376150 RepID=UPI00225B513D|nr:hypothetical protein [Paraliomyxa miuraensis]MCX4240982.1 hypothetical protein [Paraliomyxa miuraensis]
MRFDFAADPWATAMLAAAALWLMSLMVVISAFVAGTSRRTGGRIMLVSLLAFLATAAAGTWQQIQRADAVANAPPPPDPVVIEAKTPPPDADDAAAGSTGGGDPSDATGSTGDGGTGATTDATSETNGTTAGTGAATGDSGAAGAEGGASTGADEGGSTGAEDGAGPATDPIEPPDPEITKVPERVLPQNLPQVEALPTDPGARAAAIREIVQEAEKAAGGGSRCGNLERVAEAWARLRMVPVDKEAKAIAADLETCRRKLLYTISRRHRADRVKARDAYAKALRERMRKEHGLMVQVAISGQSHERLRMGNPEFDATRADALMDGGLRAELMDLEFAHVVLSNGKKTRIYEFEVTPDTELGLPDLRAVGLGEPLVLGE